MKTGVIEQTGFKIHWAKIGPVTCKRYEGKFNTDLKYKAETGLWYTTVEGQPEAVEGEGKTPRDAIRDAANRTRERINELNVALQTLTVASENAS